MKKIENLEPEEMSMYIGWIHSIQPTDLDELVHEAAACVAAEVNNSSIINQLDYAIENLSFGEVERYINDL